MLYCRHIIKFKELRNNERIAPSSGINILIYYEIGAWANE